MPYRKETCFETCEAILSARWVQKVQGAAFAVCELVVPLVHFLVLISSE